MIFRDGRHAEEWAEAVRQAGAQEGDGTVSAYFGASLFIITGMPGIYGRAKKHVHDGWIDFEAMMDMGLSTGERILVALAGNLYNGRHFGEYTPSDIVDYCDADTVELAARALSLRKREVNVNTIFG